MAPPPPPPPPLGPPLVADQGGKRYAPHADTRPHADTVAAGNGDIVLTEEYIRTSRSYLHLSVYTYQPYHITKPLDAEKCGRIPHNITRPTSPTVASNTTEDNLQCSAATYSWQVSQDTHQKNLSAWSIKSVASK
jgi:hypothetical protein